MKKLIIAAALAVGCDDLAYRGEREAPAAQEGDAYVSDDGGRSYIPRGETSAMRRMRAEIAASARETTRQRGIENDIRNGFVKSGYADIDEAVVASGRLQLVHRSFWGKKRIAEHGEADAMWAEQCKGKEDGPEEEKLGQSETPTPRWVGRPLGSSRNEEAEDNDL